jgi:hypothetical protein
MGKILDVFNDNRDVIIKRLSESLPKIANLLQEKGVYKEKEKRDENFYLEVKNLFSHVDAGGYYAEFVEALTEAREKVVADLVKGKLIFMCMCFVDRCLFFFDIQILITPLVSSNSS